ncbi:MAG: lytic murein transglycosylase [Pelagibacteraceae bacterium]|nr:lytic murein transglycosylase [Pelagibacteraceae bacterium]MBO6491996.1 lytic murein transglycosylase [Pelagibacteraceae bacterium]
MIKKLLLIFLLIYPQFSYSNVEIDFNIWLNKFKIRALKKGISEETINSSFKNAKYLEQVIKYDRYQPEFFEDTKTYINKRATRSRMLKAKALLIKNQKLFDEVEKKFNVEKELLLALWGIETNFGKHVGKMDIISSLATLSFDKRRSEFFSKELIILLNLIDEKLVDVDTLYGSWAGAYGNFQFMPSTIENYAIDYDKNGKIELKKSLHDAVASAANYINKIGWKYKSSCFHKVELTKPISEKYINVSAKKIKNYLTIKSWKKKGIVDIQQINDKYKAALIIPDLAVPEGNKNSPAFLVFGNYEKILKWNRSLRFGVTVCTLANMIRNEI